MFVFLFYHDYFGTLLRKDLCESGAGLGFYCDGFGFWGDLFDWGGLQTSLGGLCCWTGLLEGLRLFGAGRRPDAFGERRWLGCAAPLGRCAR